MDETQPVKRHQVNEVAPSSLGHLVGQHGVKAQVAVALEAAWADGRRMEHALLTGGPGLGKSQTATVIAEEMASEMHEVLGQSVEHSVELNALLLAARDNDVIHIDEAHELPKQMQTALYLALDKRVIYPSIGGKPQPIPLCDFTLLLSTTDEYRLLQPLRDRMRLNLRFDYYSNSELVEIVLQRVRGLGWQIDDLVAPMIAVRARGTPRVALSHLQAAYRCARAVGEHLVTGMHVHKACQLAQIDDRGLNATETSYLSLLADGALRLNVVASKLGLPARTVAEVTEAYLIRDGLVEKDDDGRRQLSATGYEHINASKASSIGGEHEGA